MSDRTRPQMKIPSTSSTTQRVLLLPAARKAQSGRLMASTSAQIDRMADARAMTPKPGEIAAMSMFGGIPLSHQRARSLTGAPYARTQPADPLADQARVATGGADE